MQLEPDKIAHRFVELGHKWVDADAAASLLEETKKTVFAEMMRQSNENTIGAKEAFAASHTTYKEHIDAMVEARRVANRALVEYKAAQVWIDMARSVESSRRAEMNLK